MRPLILLMLLLWLPCATASLQLVVLDVGEGQAVLLEREGHGVLIDTGHAGEAAGVLARLGDYGVHTLDYLVLSHLHPDHASGYFRLREAFPEAEVLDNGHPAPSLAVPDLVRWVAQALELDTRRRIVKAGDRLEWRGVALSFLWPERATGTNLNHNSLVLLVSYGKGQALLMGDADATIERRLLQSGGLARPVWLFLAGHHGAADCCDEGFLATVKPQLGVVSVNAGNLRGYPDPAAMARLKAASAAVRRTDVDGDVWVSWERTDNHMQLDSKGQ